MRDALEGFQGTERRFQLHGEHDDVMVVEDYAHHPTEIRATLSAAREGFGRRLLVLFQPHRFSRVRDVGEEFHRAFFEADVVTVTDIHPAGERPLPGVSAEGIFQGIVGHGHKHAALIHEPVEAARYLARISRPGDMILVLGAGPLSAAVEEILKALRNRRTA
jgi:UDP-N-acetylmuramate--alanine ligase